MAKQALSDEDVGTLDAMARNYRGDRRKVARRYGEALLRHERGLRATPPGAGGMTPQQTETIRAQLGLARESGNPEA